jgi:2-polyprenyl-6-methoxyphenol hydroxylase-like FAD-dependent oxidoreductase
MGDQALKIADFSRLPSRYPFIAILPQWDFLDFIAKEAARFSRFNLLMETEATELIEENGIVSGVRAKSAGGEIEVRADLVIAADGRHSLLREQADLEVTTLDAPMDVLWFRLSRAAGDPADVNGFIGRGEVLVMIDRGDYWQCGFLIPKGTSERLRARGLNAFLRRIGKLAPFVRERAGEIKSWEDVKLLTVAVDRLVQWYKPGLVCIGDAAHAMSPIGGVGINLAIQDAVAASNILAEPLRSGRLTVEHLRDLQHRRELPARLTQMMQVLIQNRVLKPVLESSDAPKVPLPFRLASRFPWLQRRAAQFVGMGIRPEHVRTKAVR